MVTPLLEDARRFRRRYWFKEGHFSELWPWSCLVRGSEGQARMRVTVTAPPASHLDMSTAHRPTWTPAQGKERAAGSRQYSSRDMAQQTKLKFRCVLSADSTALLTCVRRQPGQTAQSDIAKLDLRAELLLAEQEARDRKRKAEGKPVETLAIDSGKDADADDEANKRRKLLEEALEMDKDDGDDDNANEEKPTNGDSAAQGAARWVNDSYLTHG